MGKAQPMTVRKKWKKGLVLRNKESRSPAHKEKRISYGR